MKKDKVWMSLYVDEDVKTFYEEKAKEMDRSLNYVAEKALERGMEKV